MDEDPVTLTVPQSVFQALELITEIGVQEAQDALHEVTVDRALSIEDFMAAAWTQSEWLAALTELKRILKEVKNDRERKADSD